MAIAIKIFAIVIGFGVLGVSYAGEDLDAISELELARMESLSHEEMAWMLQGELFKKKKAQFWSEFHARHKSTEADELDLDKRRLVRAPKKGGKK